MLEKIHNLLGIKALMIAEGNALMWSFLQDHLCDVLSLVVAPVMDVTAEMPPTLSPSIGFTGKTIVGFSLHDVDVLDGGVLWVRYRPIDKHGEKIQ